MQNIYMAYQVITKSKEATDQAPYIPESTLTGQAYINANDHMEAEIKLRKHLDFNPDQTLVITTFSSANAEVVG